MAGNQFQTSPRVSYPVKDFLHPVFASRRTKTDAFRLPQVLTSQKRGFDKPIANIGEDAPRESKLRKVPVCNFCPFRVQRALCYHYTIGQAANILIF